MFVEHDTGDEKYECVMSKVVMRESIMLVGSVCSVVFVEAFLGILLLYLW